MVLAAGILVLAFNISKRIQENSKEARIQQDQNFTAMLNRLEQETKPENFRLTIEHLQNIPLDKLNKVQQRRWNLAMARLYQGIAKSVRGNKRSENITLAKKFYRRIDCKEDPTLTQTVHFNIIELDMLNNEWEKSVKYIDDLYQLNLSSVDKFELLFKKSKCLLKLNRKKQALEVLNELIAKCNNQNLKIDSLLLKAKILNELIAQDIISGGGNMENYVIATPSPQVGVWLEEVARAYEKTVIEMSIADPRRYIAVAGLIKNSFQQNKAKQAYKQAKDMLSTIQPRENMIHAQLIIANWEVQHKKYDLAMHTLKIAENPFPNSNLLVAVYHLKYDILCNRKRWIPAFEVLEELAGIISTTDDIDKLLDRFMPAPKNILFNEVLRFDLQDTLRRTLSILHILKSKLPNDALIIKEKIQFLFGYTAFVLADYKRAQECFQEYYANKNSNKYLEEILYLDLLVAEKTNLSPAVQICRAQRYINNANKGIYTTAVLKHQIDAYFKMHMYQDALDICKKTFGEYLNDTIVETKTLRTIVQTAQAFYYLKEFRKAENFYRKTMTKLRSLNINPNINSKEFLSKDPLSFQEELTVNVKDNTQNISKVMAGNTHRKIFPPEVYLAWADFANKDNQVLLAITRLKRGVVRYNNEEDKLMLLGNVDILALDSNLDKCQQNTFYEFEKIDKYPNNLVLKKTKQKMLKALLKNDFKYYPQKIPEVLHGIISDKKNDGWCEIWLLKYLNYCLAHNSQKKAIEKIYKLSPRTDDKKNRFTHLHEQIKRLESIKLIEEKLVALKNKGIS